MMMAKFLASASLLLLIPGGAAAGCPTFRTTVTNAQFLVTCLATSVVGARCSATCRSGLTTSYTVYPPPTWECNGVDWEFQPWTPTECSRVCTGNMPAPPANAFWDPHAATGTANTAFARAYCDNDRGFYGSPFIQCTGSSWLASTSPPAPGVVGRCIRGPMCLGLPQQGLVLNQAMWPLSCWDTPVGGTCTTTCQNTGAPLTVTCEAAAFNAGGCANGGLWSTNVTGTCT